MALTEATAALIAAGIGAAGSAGTAGIANAKNMKLARYSADFQRQMVAEQNAYNSPAAQIARYQEAGLNPALIYDNGTSSAGNQSSMAKYEAPDIRYPDPSESISRSVQAAMSTMMTKADLQIKHQQFENLKEQQFAIRAQRHSQDIENMYKSWLTGFDPGLISTALDRQGVADSLRAHQQEAQLYSVEAMTEFRNMSKSFLEVQKEVAKLTKQERQYFVDNIQPIMKDIQEKRLQGLDISNDLMDLQKKFFKADKFAGYSKDLINAVSSFIAPIKFGQTTFGPYMQQQPYWMNNMYPSSESYMPGL